MLVAAVLSMAFKFGLSALVSGMRVRRETRKHRDPYIVFRLMGGWGGGLDRIRSLCVSTKFFEAPVRLGVVCLAIVILG